MSRFTIALLGVSIALTWQLLDVPAAAISEPIAGDDTPAEAAGEEAEPEEWTAPEEASAVPNPIAVDEEALARGKSYFDKVCAKCHGEGGKGDGRVGHLLDLTPADLTESVPYQSDGELFWKLTVGRLPMPSFEKETTEEQRWEEIAYLRVLLPEPEEADEEATPEESESEPLAR